MAYCALQYTMKNKLYLSFCLRDRHCVPYTFGPRFHGLLQIYYFADRILQRFMHVCQQKNVRKYILTFGELGAGSPPH